MSTAVAKQAREHAQRLAPNNRYSWPRKSRNADRNPTRRDNYLSRFWSNCNTESTYYLSCWPRVISPKEVSHAQGPLNSTVFRSPAHARPVTQPRPGLRLEEDGRAPQDPLRVAKRPEMTARMLFGRAVKFVPLDAAAVVLAGLPAASASASVLLRGVLRPLHHGYRRLSCG